MFRPIYNLYIRLLWLAIKIASFSNEKARFWITGRKESAALLAGLSREKKFSGFSKHILIHCASLGEFEQARPLLQAIRSGREHCFITVSFFSPSGYNRIKDAGLADMVVYLPLDTPAQTRRFVAALRPDLALFIKYEFWLHILEALRSASVPLFLVSAAFREDQLFFKPYGGFFRKLLRQFDHIFVQETQSLQLLQSIGITRAEVSGDTRYDRVFEIAAQQARFPLIDHFCGSAPVLIAGSSWPEDEALLREVFASIPPDWKIVIAPHEIDAAHLTQVAALFPDAVRYSQLDLSHTYDAQVLIVDNIGMLSSLYRRASVALVGGGFKKSGIHNILEPAVFGLPVFFGPHYGKFPEAREAVSLGLAFPVQDAADFRRQLSPFFDGSARQAFAERLKAHMQGKRGAAAHIKNYLEAHHYL